MTVVLWVPLTTVPLLDEELSTCERAAQVKKKRPTGTPPSQRDPRERMLSVIHATRSLSPEEIFAVWQYTVISLKIVVPL